MVPAARRFGRRPVRLLAAAVGALVAVGLYAGLRSGGPAHPPPVVPRGEPWMHDESAITVKEASPSGEWWARTPSFVALFSIERGEGFAAIATRDGDLLFRVEWLYPRSGYWHGRFEYLVSNENHVSTWVGNLGPFWEKWNPWDPLPQAGEGDFEELHVERIEGTFGSDAEPFSLFLSEKHDPAVAHTDDAATFARLRALLAAGKAREPSPGSGR